MAKLTKRTVDAEKPGEKERFLWDSEMEGFGLRIFPTGRKSYLIQYRNAAGRTRRLTIGQHGKLTPDEARQIARERLVEVARGGDPSQARRQIKEAPTVTELAERFLAEHVEAKRKPATAQEYRRLLEKHVLPELGRRKAAEVALADVDRIHHALRETPYLANRVLAVLSALFNLAEKWGVRPRGSNPCQHVERFKESRRERFLNNDELERLGQVLTAAEQAGREPPEAILALRLLIFTGCRKTEILALLWEDVDLEHHRLLLSDSKTGPRMVPLGAPAVELLAKAPRTHGNPFVIPGRREGGHFIGLPKVWKRIRTAAGLEDVRLHDLRHSFASVGAGGGLSLPILGKLLGHSQPVTTSRYAHLAADPMQRAAEQITSEIASAMEGRTGAEVHDIAEFNRR